ncbi:MAG: GNAT family N-acetyltransferase [Demequina sp.]|uniref:GNAT family N-acetyltransferase n=1 Tax=Demequina sp. TaxID=2050685 RepID=UPI003A8AE9F9
MSALVRSASQADADAVWGLLAELVVSHRPRRVAFDADYPVVMADAGARVAVACDGERVVGYVHALLRPSLYAGGPVCWVSELVVAAGERGQGHGGRLMDDVEAWAQEMGAVEVTLATSRADAFYAGRGFRRTAGYFKKHLVDELGT